MALPIIIDCDPGHDDAIALVLALASPELEVKAITSSAGNQTPEKTPAQRAADADTAQTPGYSGGGRRGETSHARTDYRR
ncbi:nucleoside hydrolase [Salmonella enterica subsp. enterica serovar Daytona]|uniref:Nucleoside hydrolase n=1 Tax=Salmonella enterica subsp. enterica serovar Daytona TaxID=1962639 RepID=A0A447JL87_SALET|nr:nucleoside hydrolase [Salmonella enterica subsp. enterica serovar Daytona]